MLIELYINSPTLKFELYKVVDLPFNPSPKDIYHDVEFKRSFVFLSFHFTDHKVAAILMPINANYFTPEFGLSLLQ